VSPMEEAIMQVRAVIGTLTLLIGLAMLIPAILTFAGVPTDLSNEPSWRQLLILSGSMGVVVFAGVLISSVVFRLRCQA